MAAVYEFFVKTVRFSCKYAKIRIKIVHYSTSVRKMTAFS